MLYIVNCYTIKIIIIIVLIQFDCVKHAFLEQVLHNV